MQTGILDAAMFCRSGSGYARYWIHAERAYERLGSERDRETGGSAFVDTKIVEFSCRLNDDVISAFKSQFSPLPVKTSGERMEITGLSASARIYLYPDSTRIEIKRFAPDPVPGPVNQSAPSTGNLSRIFRAPWSQKPLTPLARKSNKSLWAFLDPFFTDPFLATDPFSVSAMTAFSYIFSSGGLPDLDLPPPQIADPDPQPSADLVMPADYRRLRDIDDISLSYSDGRVVLSKAARSRDAEAPEYTLWLVNKTSSCEIKAKVKVGRDAQLSVSAVEGDVILVFGSTYAGGADAFGVRHYRARPGSRMTEGLGVVDQQERRKLQRILTDPAKETKKGGTEERRGFDLLSW